MSATLDGTRQGETVSVTSIDTAKNKWSAAQALNRALDQADSEWLIIAHQDVLFPRGWLARLRNQLSMLPSDVAVVGLVGCTRWGGFRGHIIDPHGHAFWGKLPHRVVSLDEHVLIVKRDASVRFGEDIPHFHCYGTDLVLNALAEGFSAYAIDAPVVHLSGGSLDDKFAESADVLLQKWAAGMGGVIPTCAQLITAQQRNAPRHALCRLVRRRSCLVSQRKATERFRDRYAQFSCSHTCLPVRTGDRTKPA